MRLEFLFYDAELVAVNKKPKNINKLINNLKLPIPIFLGLHPHKIGEITKIHFKDDKILADGNCKCNEEAVDIISGILQHHSKIQFQYTNIRLTKIFLTFGKYIKTKWSVGEIQKSK